MPIKRTMMPTFDPESAKDYGVLWARWLEAGETITASTWTLPSGLVLDEDHEDDFSDTETRVWIRADETVVIGENYDLTNHIVTSAGREEDQTITIPVRSR